MLRAQPNLVKEISGQELVFFGVHGDDATDQVLAAKVMDKLANKLQNKAAIGLEQARRGEVVDSKAAASVHELRTEGFFQEKKTSWMEHLPRHYVTGLRIVSSIFTLHCFSSF